MKMLLKKCSVVALSLLLLACGTHPQAIESDISYSGQGENKIFIASHGWHTGLIVPSKAVFLHLPELKSRFPYAPYIEFGWGDKGFYQAQEITTKITVRAIFWPSESVVHAVAIPTDNVEAYFSSSDVNTVMITEEELDQLSQFIASSFARSDDKIISQKLGIYGDSQFYKGVGSYYVMNTCNKWTAKGLQSMGMDISPMFKLTSDSVMDYLDESTK